MATEQRSRRQAICKNEPNLLQRFLPTRLMPFGPELTAEGLTKPARHVAECRMRSRKMTMGKKIARRRRFEKTNPIS
jgi:hypothetical protein